MVPWMVKDLLGGVFGADGVWVKVDGGGTITPSWYGIHTRSHAFLVQFSVISYYRGMI